VAIVFQGSVTQISTAHVSSSRISSEQPSTAQKGSVAIKDMPHAKHWPTGAPHYLTYPQVPLTHNFQVSAQRYPDKPCLIFYGHTLTYQQAWQTIQNLANHLIVHAQVQPSDRVLLNFQNSPQFVLGYYAILLAGAMVVPINPMSKTEELRFYLEDAQCKAALVAQDVVEQVLPLVADGTLPYLIVGHYSDYINQHAGIDIPSFVTKLVEVAQSSKVINWSQALLANEASSSNANIPITTSQSIQFPNVVPDDYCVLPYTSGSTGKPKGCIHTHRTTMSAVHMNTWWKAIYPDAVVLATAPFFHVTGMIGSMHGPIYAGATIVMLPRWDAAVAAQLIETYRCTSWTNVPPMVVDVLTNPAAQGRDLSSLITIGGGGAAMPAAIAQRLKDEYKLGYMEGYGMSEFMAATHINPPQNLKKQCLGIPIFDSAAHIIDPDTLQPLGANVQGEIVMSGPNLMRGYWNMKDADGKAQDAYAGGLIQIDGRDFFRSGDLGYRDDDGYYFITDRLKRMINASGFKVWPAEVEGFFYKHPAIKECCIVAAPDSKRGETVRLVAVLKPDHASTTEQELIDWARANMATYKAPTEVHFIAALPRTSTGKLYWRQLQDQAFGRTTET
jgi:fatty-acyl-CoA synthase